MSKYKYIMLQDEGIAFVHSNGKQVRAEPGNNQSQLARDDDRVGEGREKARVCHSCILLRGYVIYMMGRVKNEYIGTNNEKRRSFELRV